MAGIAFTPKLSADDSLPCDRPNLSKGYLAGVASAESNLLRSAQFYNEQKIDLHLGGRVAAIDIHDGQVEMADGARHAFGALLLATGAEPVRLDVPGAEFPHVYYLRTVTDSRALVSKALASRRAVVIGASFIGLEVAASLRARNIDVHVVGRETIPMERILGTDVGKFIRKLHEDNGVTFHLGTTATLIDEQSVTLKNGDKLQADFVVVGIGVRPETALAARAGLAVDRGVTVNKYLEASAPRVFAAGDIARWPDRLTGESIRVEHFVVAERQGQTAARNILGQRERFDAVPFFWTEQYDFSLQVVQPETILRWHPGPSRDADQHATVALRVARLHVVRSGCASLPGLFVSERGKIKIASILHWVMRLRFCQRGVGRRLRHRVISGRRLGRARSLLTPRNPPPSSFRFKRYLGLLFRDRSDLRLLLGGQSYLRQLLGLCGVLHVVLRRFDLARHEAVNALGP